MPLSQAAARRPIHTRTIVLEGFEREDGLIDVEARLVDTKSFSFQHRKRGTVQAGSPVHDLRLRLTVDKDRVVRDIETSSDVAPYEDCQTVAPAYKSLIGAKLSLGWRRAVNEAVGGVKGCTHLRELLMPMATVAFQTMEGGQKAANRALDPNAPAPFFMNQCKAWSASGKLVGELYPRFHIQPVE